MWRIALLFAFVLSLEGYEVPDLHERLSHGRQLKIYLPKSTERLEFVPANEPLKTFLYWENQHWPIKRGRVSGTGNDRRWYIDKVMYSDEGTYIQRDFWNKVVSSLKVAVTPRRNYVKRVAGETLSISLEGLPLADASLAFSGEAGNISLVHDGARVSQDNPDFWDRVTTSSHDIQIRHVNSSDVGRYHLVDRQGRLVSVTRMDLTDHHEYNGAHPLLALLLLLGIPVGVCCCCKNKLTKKNTATTTVQATPETVHQPPDPVGPPPSYNIDPNMGPTVQPPPSPGQWTGPPPAGFNPAYPPVGPALYPPAQPPQWTGPQPAPYAPPSPGVPMGYSPVMYSAPPTAPSGDVVEMEVKTHPSPTEPLLGPAPAVGSAPMAPAPPSTDSAHQFQIDMGKNSSTNFL